MKFGVTTKLIRHISVKAENAQELNKVDKIDGYL